MRTGMRMGRASASHASACFSRKWSCAPVTQWLLHLSHLWSCHVQSARSECACIHVCVCIHVHAHVSLNEWVSEWMNESRWSAGCFQKWVKSFLKYILQDYKTRSLLMIWQAIKKKGNRWQHVINHFNLKKNFTSTILFNLLSAYFFVRWWGGGHIVVWFICREEETS